MHRRYQMPPKIFHRFFRWFCTPELLRRIEGDLLEEYGDGVIREGKLRADLKFIVDVVLLFRPGIVRSFERPKNVNTYGMYKSYLIVAWRTFLKSKGYSTINILGLSIGLTACLLITLYVHHELSFDRFNEKADRIYRVNNEIKFGGNHLDLAVANPLFGATAKAEFPQVEESTRLRWYGGFLVRKGDANLREGNVAFADSTLFDVFTLPMISGDPKTALSEPNSIVLTESVAKKYFDRTDVAGMTLTINNTETRKVTGVIKDLPPTCHFQFTSFVPMMEDEGAQRTTWAGGQNYNTYLLLKPGVDPDALAIELDKMLERHLEPELKSIINKTLEEFEKQGDFFNASLTKLTDVHLHSQRVAELYGSGKIEYVYMFSVIAVFILFIAIINFMNLATARSANRAREVGVRKVLGSLKRSLVKQFITESFLTCAGAMLLAIALTTMLLPYFNELTGKIIDAGILFSRPMLIMLFGLILIVGLLAGSYPAFYLSAFQPATVLKGSKGISMKKSFLRNVLVVFQFTASVILIVGTLIIFRQMEFIQKTDVGYDREQILIINNVSQIGKGVDAFKNEILRQSGVEKATVSGYLPVNYYRSNDSFFSSPTLETQGAISMQSWLIDENYIPTMNMQIVQGRNFTRDMATDSTAIILNEAAAKFLGDSDIIGKKLYRITDAETKAVMEYHVVGVVKDFHFATLRDQVKPLSFAYGEDLGGLSVKVNTGDMSSLIDSIEKLWKKAVPDLPFEYSFMDQDYDKLYVGERQVGKLFVVFASLSIFISCLGLFGLATFMAEQRTKEIGIRKVLGASVSGITLLLSRDFLKLVLISVAVAIPVAWYFMNQWLQGFAYRIDIDWWVFLMSGMIAVVIAIITVSYQAIVAGMANPVNSLRTE